MENHLLHHQCPKTELRNKNTGASTASGVPQPQAPLAMTRLCPSSGELPGMLASAGVAVAMPRGVLGCSLGSQTQRPLQALKGSLPQLSHPWQVQSLAHQVALRAPQCGPGKTHPWLDRQIPAQEPLGEGAEVSPSCASLLSRTDPALPSLCSALPGSRQPRPSGIRNSAKEAL